MANDATVEQVKPKGTGREIAELVKQDVDTRSFIVPEHGLITVALWLRSAAAYLKSRQLEKASPGYPSPLHAVWAFTVANELKADVEARTQLGEARYGERLRAHNGRDALVDAYQEVLDGWQYLRQFEEESDDVR